MARIIELRSKPGHTILIQVNKIVEVEVKRFNAQEDRVVIWYAGGTKKVLSEPHASEFLERWRKMKRGKNPLALLTRLLGRR
jgi:hypothetical protein